MTVKIIAEAGVNHNGDLSLAKELVSAAADSGADVVKFQTFKAENLVTKTAEKAQYQKENSGADESQFEMLKKLELNEEMHFEILETCKKHNIEFLSTAFDHDSLHFLTDTMQLKTLKIPSGEVTNGPLILEHAQKGSRIILSTGMSTLDEIEAALAVLAYGFCTPDIPPEKLEACFQIYNSDAGQAQLNEKITLLHCTTNYPASAESLNLRALDTLRDRFDLPVGYSDHSEGTLAAVAAVAKGATIIEKHFTLDKNMEGPDHKASLDPDVLKVMVEQIRSVEKMLGNGKKVPHSSELKNKDVARKSLVALSNIDKSDKFTPANVGILRPGTGLSPMEYWTKINKTSDQTYQIGELIK